MWLIGERYIPPIFYSEFFSHIYLKLNSAEKESRWNFGEENLEVYLFFMCLCCVAWRYGLWGDRATLNNGGTGLTRTSVTGMCPPGPGTIHSYWGGKIYTGSHQRPSYYFLTSLARSNTVTLGFDCSFRSWWYLFKDRRNCFHLSGDQKQTLSLKMFVQCNSLQMRLNVVRGNGTRESASTHS